MSVFVIGNFVTFTDTAEGKTRYQNFFSQGQKEFAGQTYQLLPFNYQGAQKTKSGDNISSQLTLPANPITLNWAQSAVNSGWQVNVKTYQLTDVYDPYLLLGDETWIATGLTYNTQAVEMELSSAIDAIGAQAPNLRISREAVGALPSTGAIRSG
jgi:hypothetical protein